ncbi:MAG TPA: hypothetical protein VNS22_18850 [Geminicoccus sp.]|uniref:phage head-tail joining protein n=1 Tax=Geminicoccus sp. TaxID=2024832 RepID=UPI002C53C799|nr:hypothetical protein [Geminicoccus sp.]HWL70419.1 hypothetical protein [Geminicoccus sp.]
MATLSELQAQRAALANSIASGSQEVRDQFGRYIKYRSLDEMRSILSDLDSQIGALAVSPVRRTRAVKLVYGGRDY